MPFRFPLSSVLRVRESIEMREERRLQQLQIDLSRLARSLDELETDRRRILDRRAETITRPIAAAHLHNAERSLQENNERQRILSNELTKVTEQRDRQMQVYMSARRDRELLTELMIKQKSRYSLESIRREQSNLDDLFNSRRDR